MLLRYNGSLARLSLIPSNYRYLTRYRNVQEDVDIPLTGRRMDLSAQQYTLVDRDDVFGIGGTCANVSLPSGYTRIPYIENSAAAYIDTLYKFNADDRIIISCRVYDTTNTEYKSLFGARTDPWTRNYAFFTRFYGVNKACYSRCGQEVSGTGMLYNEDIVVEASGCTISWRRASSDTAAGSITISGTPTSTDVSCYLFVINNNNGSPDASPSHGKIYRCRIAHSDGTIAADMIPAIRDSDQVVGMYDTVRGKYLPNKGGALNTVNRNMHDYNQDVSLPSGYTKLAYVENYTNSYIDTGLTFGPSSSMTMDAYVFSDTSCSYQALFGGRSGIASKDFALFTRFGSNTRPAYSRGGSEVTLSNTMPYDCMVKISCSGKSISITSGATSDRKTVSGSVGYTTNNIFLFDLNNNGTRDNSYCRARIYSCRFYDASGQAVSHMVPARDSTSGKVGLYDVIRQQFLTDATSGCLYGAELHDVHDTVVVKSLRWTNKTAWTPSYISIIDSSEAIDAYTIDFFMVHRNEYKANITFATNFYLEYYDGSTNSYSMRMPCDNYSYTKYAAVTIITNNAQYVQFRFSLNRPMSNLKLSHFAIVHDSGYNYLYMDGHKVIRTACAQRPVPVILQLSTADAYSDYAAELIQPSCRVGNYSNGNETFTVPVMPYP